jgi:hypothetical protein
MSEYLILITADGNELTQTEEQQCISEYGDWAQALAEKHIVARRLSTDEGEFVKSKRSISTDGPFVEAKELVAGFILVQAETLQEAKEIASSCPLNQHFHLFVKKTN